MSVYVCVCVCVCVCVYVCENAWANVDRHRQFGASICQGRRRWRQMPRGANSDITMFSHLVPHSRPPNWPHPPFPDNWVTFDRCFRRIAPKRRHCHPPNFRTRIFNKDSISCVHLRTIPTQRADSAEIPLVSAARLLNAAPATAELKVESEPAMHQL